MKITFTGQYKDVIKQVNAPLEYQPNQGKSFTQTLGDLELQNSQPIVNNTENRIPISQTMPSIDEAMARLSPSFYEQKPPELENMLELPAVNFSPSDVKPPAVVSAKRVPSGSSSLLPKEEIRSMIDQTGLQVGVDPLLALSVARSESSFNPNAVSQDGHASKGLFQLLDSTGQHLHSKLDLEQDYDPFNATMNTKLGVNYLRYLHEIFAAPTALPNKVTTVPAENSSDLEKLAVAAFNAGEGRVASAQARAAKAGLDPSQYMNVESYLPDITQAYVSRVIKYRNEYENKS